MHLTPEIMAPVVARYGAPRDLHLTRELSPDTFRFLVSTTRGGRRIHDVTFFIFGPDGRLAVIQKPNFPSGVYRAPSGGVKPGEDFTAGVQREAWEETGLSIELQRYLLRIRADFTCGGEVQPWWSLVFCAKTEQTELQPHDHQEIAGARWVTLAELQGPIRQAMVDSGRSLLRYRVDLHDATVALLPREA